MEKTQTLLSKAKAAKPRKRVEPNRDLARLSVAWATDEVSLTQVRVALGVSGTAMYSSLARGLRDAVQLGLLAKGKSGA